MKHILVIHWCHGHLAQFAEGSWDGGQLALLPGPWRLGAFPTSEGSTLNKRVAVETCLSGSCP